MLGSGVARLGAVCLVAWVAVQSAAGAAECPGNPDALGTSRVLVVDPSEHARLGTMQYRETLPLEPGEVVLTFDDGPLPPYTNRIMEALDSQCVKATYFLVGRMAQSYPDMVRKLHAAGHTIGTHSQNHPFTFHKMPRAQAQAEIEAGIASVTAALGSPDQLAPFFRIPGLLRANDVEDYLADRAIMTWSADVPSDDWRRISATEIVHRSMARLEAKGKGVLLMHDIHPATALAVPMLLKELKQHGYRIVHVVPATAERPKTATLPSQWLMNPAKDPLADVWPRTVAALPETVATPRLATPSAQMFGIGQPTQIAAAIASPAEHARAGRSKNNKMSAAAQWPRHARMLSIIDLVSREELPVPHPESFGYSSVPAQPAAPQKRAAVQPEPTAFSALRGPVRETGEASPAPMPRPGSWPVTTASMPRSGFP